MATLADGPATESRASTRDRGWWSTLTDPTVAAVILYASAAVAATVAAYFTIFTVFAPYDDEGTLLVTLKAFAHGGALYRDIYSEYGPFFYELFGGLFALSGHAVTTDASRSITVLVWVAASLLFGIAAQRLTGRLALGIACMAAAFGALGVLATEPMHPQGLAVLLLGAFFVIAAREPTRRVGWAGAACGALLAALLLTKINLGVFAAAPVVVAAAWTLEPLHRRRWVLWPVLAAFLLLPLAITLRDLKFAWTRELALLVVFATIALLAAAWPLRPQRGESSDPLPRWLLSAAVAFVLAAVAILVAIVLTGPSPSDVYNGLIVQALRVRDVLVEQFPFPPAALDWGIAAIVVAILTTRFRSLGGGKPSIWPGLLRALAGVAILLTVARIPPLRIGPSAGNPDIVALLLAWVAAIAPGAGRESPYKRFLRVLLPALAILETLQVYPVPGSQMGIAAVTFVPVAAICLGDALVSLRAWGAEQDGQTVARLKIAVTVVTVALGAQLVLDTMLRPAATTAIAYGELESLPLPGATALHLQGTEVESYTRLVELLKRYRCTTFIGYPNIDSLYLWSGIEAPPPAAPGAWIKALDNSEQQRVVDELKASPRPCAVIDEKQAAAWLNGSPPPDAPLVNYIHDDFAPVEEFGDFQFALPKSRVATNPDGGSAP